MTQRRRAVTILLALVGMVAWLAFPAAPGAFACSCGVRPTVGRAVADAEFVFVGRQVDLRVEPARNDAGLPTEYLPDDFATHYGQRVLTIEVSTVYKGEVSERVELRAPAQASTCGSGVSPDQETGFVLTPDRESRLRVDSCAGTVDVDELRQWFAPLPTAVGTGPPGFVVGLGSSPARIAILDTAGELLTFGAGPGRVAAVAVCPGGERLVEVVEPDLDPRDAWEWPLIGGSEPVTLDVRRLRDLTIESSTPIELRSRKSIQHREASWVRDLACHDPDATLVTYLLPIAHKDDPVNVHVGAAQTHVWDHGRLTKIEVGPARAIAVDPVAGVFHAVVGVDETRLETRRLDDGGQVDQPAQLGGHDGWRLALSSDGTRLAALVRGEPPHRAARTLAEVDTFVVLDLDSGVTTSTVLPWPGFALALDAVDDGFLALIRGIGVVHSHLVSADGDRLRDLDLQVGDSAQLGSAATGTDATVLTMSTWRADAVRVVDGVDRPIDGVPAARVAAALPAGVVLDLRAVEPMVGVDARRPTASGSPDRSPRLALAVGAVVLAAGWFVRRPERRRVDVRRWEPSRRRS